MTIVLAHIHLIYTVSAPHYPTPTESTIVLMSLMSPLILLIPTYFPHSQCCLLILAWPRICYCLMLPIFWFIYILQITEIIQFLLFFWFILLEIMPSSSIQFAAYCKFRSILLCTNTTTFYLLTFPWTFGLFP